MDSAIWIASSATGSISVWLLKMMPKQNINTQPRPLGNWENTANDRMDHGWFPAMDHEDQTQEYSQILQSIHQPKGINKNTLSSSIYCNIPTAFESKDMELKHWLVYVLESSEITKSLSDLRTYQSDRERAPYSSSRSSVKISTNDRLICRSFACCSLSWSSAAASIWIMRKACDP